MSNVLEPNHVQFSPHMILEQEPVSPLNPQDAAGRSVHLSFDNIVQDRFKSSSIVISSLVTSLNSDLKESLHKDLESTIDQLARVDEHIDQVVEHILHLFDHEECLAIYI